MRGTRSSSALLTVAFVMATGLGAANAAGDAEKGERTFKKCVACHSLEEGKRKIGPSLHKIIGKKAGTEPDFKYSDSYVQAGEKGLVWNAETLMPYLENPKDYLRDYLDDKKAKSKMVLRIKKEGDREDIIAYLESLQAE